MTEERKYMIDGWRKSVVKEGWRRQKDKKEAGGMDEGLGDGIIRCKRERERESRREEDEEKERRGEVMAGWRNGREVEKRHRRQEMEGRDGHGKRTEEG